MVSMLPRLGRLTHVAHTGRAPAAAFTAAMQRAMLACVSVAGTLRVAAVDSVRRRAKTLAKAAAAAAAVPASAAAVGVLVSGAGEMEGARE